MKQNQFIAVITLFLCITVTQLFSQDHSRFKNVKKWKINFKIEDNGTYDLPQDFLAGSELHFNRIQNIELSKEEEKKWNELVDDIEPMIEFFNAMIHMDEKKGNYSRTIEHSYMKGDLNFDKKDPWEPLTWTGSGKIDCVIDSETIGYHFGSYAGSSTKGEGTTRLYSDESYFSIDIESGTYDLYLLPGDGDSSGITVKITSFNDLVEDVYNQIANQMLVNNENIEDLKIKLELTEENKEFTKKDPGFIDLFYSGNMDQWIVEVESRKIQTKGLVIKGKEQVTKNRIITWEIKPAN